MTIFHDATELVPARLGPATPLGYLRSLDRESNGTDFLIVEHKGVKVAVILAAKDPRWLFEAVPLEKEDTAWGGVNLGAVEVLVDLATGDLYDQPMFQRGAITITGGRVYLSAVPSGRLGSRIAIDLAAAAPFAGTASAVFTRWQLVQRDREGRPVVLFEAGSAGA